MKKSAKKLFIIAVITAAVILIITLIITGRHQNPLPENVAGQPVSSVIPSIPEGKGSAGVITHIAEPLKATIHFSDTKGFTPNKRSLAYDASGTGCLLVVINDSDKELTVRVSPYTPKDALGVAYPSIPSHETSIIDARYHMPEIQLHNHENPAQEFSLHFDTNCF